ncbi:Uu.00g071750.m01.CDS01 [Anthostomella pinea]|uniref:Uu.00g071750.m01.CDS01 n=1 Tax=Anthostomella pinea TaxID=933095 RepID=A0AAI8VVU2_9PEZI|nr:Uu.00g071750.m01.CDS01 [Anthostomella pinea]
MTRISNLPFLPWLLLATTSQAQTEILPETDLDTAPANFPTAFATSMAVAIAVVLVLTTLICVFAHCWRRILDHRCFFGSGGKLRDHEEWFASVDRPHFKVPAPQLRPDPRQQSSEPMVMRWV